MAQTAKHPQVTILRQNYLRAIVDLTAKSGYPPSIRELADLMGVTSPSTVHGHLDALQESGLIHRVPDRPRTLTVTELGRYVIGRGQVTT